MTGPRVVETGVVPLSKLSLHVHLVHSPERMDRDDEGGLYPAPADETVTVEFSPVGGGAVGYSSVVPSALWGGDSASTIRRLIWAGTAQAAWERAHGAR